MSAPYTYDPGDGQRKSGTEGPIAGPRRGVCGCGWTGPWHIGPRAGWDAQADTDEHNNADEHGSSADSYYVFHITAEGKPATLRVDAGDQFDAQAIFEESHPGARVYIVRRG
jgi:hypothetical protein